MENTAPPSIGRAQPSIRSFFEPRQPNYTPPPNPQNSKPNPSPSNAYHATPQIPSRPTAKETSLDQPQGGSITPVTLDHITPLRRINSLLLPIHYPDAFYHAITKPSPPSTPNFSRTILWEEKVIGGLVCRLDPSLADDSTPQAPKYIEGVCDIYIQSLVLLSPYRGKGLATKVLEDIVQAAVEEKGVRIAGLYAHVWTDNTEALEWYTARGFKKEEAIIPGYYRRLKPDTAWILRRRLNPSDHLNHSTSAPIAPLSSNTRPPTETSSVSSPVPPRPTQPPHTRSFQDRGPDREWNDLPEEVLGNALLKPASNLGSQAGSTTSSRSSSRSGVEGRGKKKRVYPAAAFGS